MPRFARQSVKPRMLKEIAGMIAMTQGKLPAKPPIATASRMWLAIRLVRNNSCGMLAFLI